MILTTSGSVEGRQVEAYLGIVFGEAIVGANLFRDLFAQIRDIVGRRSGAYEAELRRARELALEETEEEARRPGADAFIGIDADYEVLGGNNSMPMATASGTAVRLKPTGLTK